MVNFVDFKDVYQALGMVVKNVERAGNKVLDDLAPDLAKKLESRTPVWDGKNYMDKSRGSYTLEKMRDHIVFSKAKDGRVEIGFDDDVSWRVHFVEFGTMKQPPQAFIQKTIDEIEREIVELIRQRIMKELI